MEEGLVLCIDVEGERFCNGFSGIEIEGEEYLSLSSFNILQNFSERGVVLHFNNEDRSLFRFQGKRMKLFYYRKGFGKKFEQKLVVYKAYMVSSGVLLELLDISLLLQKGKASYFSQSCRANFGDELCKVDISKFSINGIVQGFSVAKNEIYDDGLLLENLERKFDGGTLLIEGESYLVLNAKSGVVKLFFEGAIECKVLRVGTPFKLLQRCNKTIKMCTEEFNNACNFCGEPFIFDKFSSSII